MRERMGCYLGLRSSPSLMAKVFLCRIAKVA
jgi:hypothetical protein